ncbi:MAG: UDP-N-acetylmuramoyl-L-alanyl-D-glutamate--2,6-diaminopimelate ligase [Xanthomonadaceae bacterium]|nr:UDP-N-acetylmuramoyl-L-alanyl-D-glutamate--2,6-diaminopimelate ligase [Xanthomonadaceae bacterium]
MSLRLAELLPDLQLPPGLGGLVPSGLCADSRRLRPGEAFVALAGASSHGLQHAEAVRARGAVALLHDPAEAASAGLAAPAGAIAVPGLRARLGALADRFHDAPSAALRVVGVTGTNGKTSTVHLLAEALERLGTPAGSIGTLGAGRVGRLVAGERTTPDVLSVHALLAGLRDAGAKAVAMEVSSHALDQGRVDGVRFALAVFTNLSRDHLDYHGDMAAYGAAKARLFAWPGLPAMVLNLDDAFGRGLASTLPARLSHDGHVSIACWTVSAAGDPAARLRAEGLVLAPDGLRFDLVEGGCRAAIASPLLGRFNADNLLAVAGALRALGFDFAAVAAVLPRLGPVPGRMTRLGGGAAPLVLVDYAHTPDALALALGSLRGHVRGRLFCLFGCGGERDRGKRAEMAAVAERLADRVLVTDDNPRGEDGDAIVADILGGFREPTRHAVLRDRRAAIRAVLAEAGPGDVVLLAGKGHEPYQEIAGTRHPFDDLAEARAALEARA